MGERTSYAPGTFSWVELSTTDADGAKGFYTGLFGWDAEDNPIPGDGVYTMLNLRGKPVAALYQQMEQEGSAGMPPHWNSYVTVEDVDATAARAKEFGGTLLAEPFDVMEVGRMSVVQDPTGAVFSLWQPRQHIGAQIVNDAGAFTWNELGTKDVDAAKRFYGDLFGWQFNEFAEGYWVIMNGERSNGAVRSQSPQESDIPPNWLVYFTVENTDESLGAVESAGGRTLVPPMDLGPGRIAVVADPQGAAFALYAGRVDD
jgi:predicted enzyme related to lactoylglutathione lyase